MNRKKYIEIAKRFVQVRMGLWDARPGEFLSSYIGAFKPVYVKPQRAKNGEPEFMWFIHPGKETREQTVCVEVVPGSYLCEDGKIHEHDPRWVIVFGMARIDGKQLFTNKQLSEWLEDAKKE